MLSNYVRPGEILRIRAFLMQDGEDYESMPISLLPKYAQLAFLLAKIKQPKEGWTLPELALSFYGKTSDVKKAKDLVKESNDELMKWTPSYLQYNRMKALAHNLRNRLIRRGANPNYCVKVPMQDFNNEPLNIMIPIKSIVQFDHNIVKLRKQKDGLRVRIEQIEDLKAVPVNERANNTKKTLNEWRWNSKT